MTFNVKSKLSKGLIAAVAMTMGLPAMAAETTISAASCFPIGSPPSRPFEAVVAAINEQGAGVIQIDLVGGAPAIGSNFTIVQKMSRGVYDFVGCPEGYFSNVLPESEVFHMAETTYADLRENGALDYMAGLLAEKNITYLGRYHDFGPFYLWLSQKIDSPDLSGLHIRSAPAYTPFFQAMGATVQTSSMPQVFTYMENGTVQGFGWPALAWSPSWTPVTKYRVEPGFYAATLHAMINQGTWEALSDAQRAVITDVVMAAESAAEFSGDEVQQALSETFAKLAEGGIEAITFEGEEAETWSNTAREAGWAEVIAASPEHGPKLRELWTN